MLGGGRATLRVRSAFSHGADVDWKLTNEANLGPRRPAYKLVVNSSPCVCVCVCVCVSVCARLSLCESVCVPEEKRR